jgi:hypothetical protein
VSIVFSSGNAREEDITSNAKAALAHPALAAFALPCASREGAKNAKVFVFTSLETPEQVST